ncbi:MAG: phosphate ABC transporter permease PstA [Pseudomonadales bacterium]|jgi:phosphate transport system permease protein|nr:phosphate ABC transporter permease PstA [Pseudomonadales bacterium]
MRHDSDSPAGEIWRWLGAGFLAAALIMVLGILALLTVRGLGHFWPDPLWEIVTRDASGMERTWLGAVTSREASARSNGDADGERLLLRTANRDLAPPDFRWIEAAEIVSRSRPRDAVVLERTAWGPAQGYLLSFTGVDGSVATGPDALPAAASGLARAATLRAAIDTLRRTRIAVLSDDMEATRSKLRRDDDGPSARRDALRRRLSELQRSYAEAESDLRALERELDGGVLSLRLADGRVRELPLATVLRLWQPNTMHWGERLVFQLRAIGRFLVESPREANTEGGVFPAIFGTVLLVLLMALLVTPLGVIAAVYMHEYARPGPGTRALRIAVNNLAGVPSIVYGVFGLGFFVYVVGGSLDRLFFGDALPAPTFGTPGLLWAALTLALLTVPVVIVSTEEGLARIPREIREGSLALGATRAETLLRVVLPSAAPAILTGVILAVARAAGEVAPLMLVGVVKLAPRLPVDGDFPWLHLDRQFMHLGFHIYDVGFQSPNVEAARPLVFATALLLVLVIMGLNLVAIVLRGRLNRRYGAMDV